MIPSFLENPQSAPATKPVSTEKVSHRLMRPCHEECTNSTRPPAAPSQTKTIEFSVPSRPSGS